MSLKLPPIHVAEDIRFRAHRSPDGHPERPARLDAVSRILAQHEAHLERISLRPAEPSEILRIHTRDHLDGVREASARAPAHLDPDTFVSEESFDVACLAAGASIELALAIGRDEARSGLAAIRPPGHHAERARPMGFCLFNNIAIAARALQSELDLEKILILDWDVHHGNGTQDAFRDDPSVLFISLHQFPHYPGTGRFTESGTGTGLGTTVNLPMPAGCGDSEYVGMLQQVVVPIARHFAPQMILVSCGFDAHRDDPLGAMMLTGEGYAEMTRIVQELAQACCAGRVLFVLEGGYAESGLEEGTHGVLSALAKMPGPSAQPEVHARGSTVYELIEAVRTVHGERYPEIGSV